MNIRPLDKYSKGSKEVLKVGAITGLVLAGLGATNAAPSSHFIAKTNTLTPVNFQRQPVAPLVEESVQVQAAPEEAPVQIAIPPTVVAPSTVALASTPVYSFGGDIFARIRMCESHGNYSTNTGNGYYGAYQYDRSTWNNYHGYSSADQAPASVQDQKAQSDYQRRGASPWPVCGRR